MININDIKITDENEIINIKEGNDIVKYPIITPDGEKFLVTINDNHEILKEQRDVTLYRIHWKKSFFFNVNIPQYEQIIKRTYNSISDIYPCNRKDGHCYNTYIEMIKNITNRYFNEKIEEQNRNKKLEQGLKEWNGKITKEEIDNYVD